MLSSSIQELGQSIFGFSISFSKLIEKLNVDIYLAAIIVFVGRMFTNLAIIRRYYIDIIVKKIENKKNKNKDLDTEKTE